MMARTLNAKTTKAGKATAPRRAVRARAAETNDTPPPAPKAPTFVAAAGAELSSHESVAQQFGDAPLPIVLTAVTFAVASLVPILKGAIDEHVGPLPNVFNANVELLNGRVAMLGLAGLLVTEYLSGQATF